MSFLDAACKEIEEELGLPAADLPRLLAERAPVPVGEPYFAYDQRLDRNPPFHNAEARQIYAATLTEAGLACLAPDYEELAGLYICSPDEAWDVLAREPVASGLRFSLPRFLDWRIRRPPSAS